MTALPATLRALVGDDGVLDQAGDLAGYRGDFALQSDGPLIAVVRPRTTAEVAAVVRACADAGVTLTPRGGGTGGRTLFSV